MMPNVAFFTNPLLVSSKTRGEQIAERLGAPVNVLMDKGSLPKHIVFVKTIPGDLLSVPETTTIWFDPIDTDTGLEFAALNPKVNVLAIGDTAYKYLKARLQNKVVKIPEHHCNFKRERRVFGESLTVGFVGYPENIDLDLDVVKSEFGKLGAKFVSFAMRKDSTREDVVAFYRDTIDVQLVFRLPRFTPGMPPEMKNPLKVINAASFGIPTIGFEELNYEEEFPIFSPCNTFEDVLAVVERMTRSGWWWKQDELIQKAESYHIDNIVQLYKEVLI